MDIFNNNILRANIDNHAWKNLKEWVDKHFSWIGSEFYQKNRLEIPEKEIAKLISDLKNQNFNSLARYFKKAGDLIKG
jgi:hypothetical protein